MGDFGHLERANDVALFLDDTLGKVAAQHLADVDPDLIAIFERRGSSHRYVSDHDWPVGFDDLQLTDAWVKIKKNFKKTAARRSRREQDVIRFEQARIVGHEIFGF